MEKIFIDGMRWIKPSEKTPEYIKGKISIKLDDFTEFAKKHQKNGWLNIDLCKSQGGNLYLSLNTFEPKKQETPF